MNHLTQITCEPLSVPADPGLLLRRLPVEPGRFVLESQAGPAELCRYSFLGYRPFLRLRCHGNHYTLTTPDGMETGEAEPLLMLDKLLSRYAVAPQPGLPPFVGGAVGYLAYDLIRPWHPIPTDKQDEALPLPDLCLDFYDVVVAVDHLQQAVFLLSAPFDGNDGATDYRRTALRNLLTTGDLAPAGPDPATAQPTAGLSSNFTPGTFIAAVQTAQAHMNQGHLHQINLAHRLQTTLPVPVPTLWQRLRTAGGSPFGAYLDYGDCQILSASPERYLHVLPQGPARQRFIETRPIKGTRPRGRTPAEDHQQAQALLENEREQAELALVSGLSQSELEAVCLPGSVNLVAPRQLETYPGVHHTAAVITGRPLPDVTTGDLLRATFPPASIAGVPRAVALDLIATLETVPRGLYTGALGYFSFDGHVDLSVLIRTLIVRDGAVALHVGSGIVADADAAAEYDETLHKAATLLQALGCAIPDGVLQA